MTDEPTPETGSEHPSADADSAAADADSPSADGDSEPDWRRIANAAGFVLLLAVVAVFVATAVPQAVGADHSFVVLSDSMSPSIGAGAVVFVEEVPAEQIEEGDVITYEQSGQRVTHRVVGIEGSEGDRRFRTKGDANEEADTERVSASDIVGVVTFHLPHVGRVVTFVQSGTGIVVTVVLPALLLIALELRDFASAASTADDEEAGGGGED